MSVCKYLLIPLLSFSIYFSWCVLNLGLGTSDSKEAKEYFSDMVRHRVKFNYRGAEDDSNICMVSCS